MKNSLKHIIMLVIVVVAAYFAQQLVISGVGLSSLWEQTSYSLVGLYTFGFVSSLVVIIAIEAINYALPKFLGLLFLALMFLKAIAAYIYINDGLNKFENDFIEYNFLAMFFIMLFFDVFIAFKALNQQDSTDKTI